MSKLFERCKANNIDAEILDQKQLNEIEPNVFGVGVDIG